MPLFRWMVAAAILLAAPPLFSQTRATEEQVRSAFLYQLAQFVSWPAESAQARNGAMTFCVLGNEPLAEALGPVVRGKTIEGREIRVLKLLRAEELGQCHLAFVGYSNAKQLRELLANSKGSPVLLIGEGESFVEMGGMVALGMESGRVSFAVNLEATTQAGLTMRSQLLRFARLVRYGAVK